MEKSDKEETPATGPGCRNEADPADPANVYLEQRMLEAESSAEPLDVCSKAKEYLTRTKEAAVAAVQARFADNKTTYDAIKSYNDRSLMACSPAGSECTPLEMGSFFSGGDGRMANCVLRPNFSKKTNTSYSFCPDNWQCCSCETQHKILTNQRDEVQPTRSAFMLCDQGGPPCLASKSSDGPCIPTIRMESGMLRELAEAFFSAARMFRPCPGSICIISSATQLALGGAADYIRDLATISGWFYSNFKGEVELVPGPIYLINGSNSRPLLGAMLDLSEWCATAGEQASLFIDTMRLATETALSVGTGPTEAVSPRSCRLPSDLAGDNELKPWIFADTRALPAATKAWSAAKEETINHSLRRELQSKRNLAVGSLSADRGLSAVVAAAEAKRKKFLIIGASNSERLLVALEARGIHTGLIKTTNWKPSPEAVSELEEHIRRGVDTFSPECVVFEILDNLVYLGRAPDGTTTLPKRDSNGIYHVCGDLIVADKTVQYNLYKAVRPLMMAVGNRPLILVTPFPRYVSSPCCHEEGHITNFREPDYVDGILAHLVEVRSNFKSFLFSDRIRRANVINPGPIMEDKTAGPHWADPVHPASDSFDKLSELVIESGERLLGKRKFEEEASLVREARGGWSGNTNRSREWRGPNHQEIWDHSRGRGSYRGRPARGGFKSGGRGGYRRDSY